ncbi:MAG: sulfite exporter TauE/SafE family protein [Flavobacteriaceae bacterium]
MDTFWVFYLAFPITAFLYASIGHGGASGYLALMSLFSFSPEIMKPTALVLNIFVSGISFYHYFKAGHFHKRLFLSFVVTSIPCSFLGGLFEVDATLYKQILALFLIFAILKILNVFGKEVLKTHKVKLWQGALVGMVIGFFSGLIGIGGGIILTPVILLFHWGKMKEAAAVSALFILVNSISGLAGQITKGITFSHEMFLLLCLVVVGGFLGSYFGSERFNNSVLRYVLAVVLMLASIKLVFI